jgi:RNA polymerase sigma-70 factor (ECF subfamily)
MPTDAELVAAHAAGDPDALPQLWQRHQHYVRCVVAHLLGHHRDDDDLAQEVAVRLVVSVHRWQATASFTSWLYRVTRNAVFDHLRRSRLRAAVPMDMLDWDELERAICAGEAGYEQVEHRDQLAGLLGRLSDDRLCAVVLVHHDGLPLVDAAQWLGVPVGTVKSRCHRGLAELREAVAA